MSLIFFNTGLQKETIYDRDTLSECNDRRNDRIEDGWLCLGDCELLEPEHIVCRGIRDYEIGNYAFFGDIGSCSSLNSADREAWECFYNSNPDEGNCLNEQNFVCNGDILLDACGVFLSNCGSNGLSCGITSDMNFNHCYDPGSSNDDCSRGNLGACNFNDQACIDDDTVCSHAEFIDGFVYCEGPQFITSCQTGTSCSEGSCIATSCTNGAEVCDGNNRRECQNGNWVNVEFCSNGCVEESFVNTRCSQENIYYCLSNLVDCTFLETSGSRPATCYDTLEECKGNRAVYCLNNNCEAQFGFQGNLPAGCMMGSGAQSSCFSQLGGSGQGSSCDVTCQLEGFFGPDWMLILGAIISFIILVVILK